MEETRVDALDSRLLNSIFLLTEGRDVARLRLVCREWQQKIDDAQVEGCQVVFTPSHPPWQKRSHVSNASQIPKELFKKTWGITEMLGEPRKPAMYLVSFEPHWLWP